MSAYTHLHKTYIPAEQNCRCAKPELTDHANITHRHNGKAIHSTSEQYFPLTVDSSGQAARPDRDVEAERATLWTGI